ncbi:MAG: type II secretion system F family protein [Planctomycetota bacterium]|jgi:type II secretory pathway component PulF
MSTQSFHYVARDKSGGVCKGVLAASTQNDAFRRVQKLGLIPVKISPARQRRAMLRKAARLEEITQFTHELAVLLEAGILLPDGLHGIAEQMRNPRFRAVVLEIASQIQAGDSIYEAMEKHESVFGEVYVQTIRAAEQSGSLPIVLTSLAEMLERQEQFHRTVRKALSYPVLVTVTLTIAVAFLLAFVVPRFGELFEQRGVELPLITRTLQMVGVSLRDHWWIYGLCVIGGAALLRRASRVPQVRIRIDRLVQRIPYISTLLTGGSISRFTRILALCLKAGLPITDALEHSGRAAARPLLQCDAKMLAGAVRRGETISESLASCHGIPPFAKRMLAAGEQSAQLSKMCKIVAKHYERETTHLATQAATVIEPVLILALTGIVMLVALAIFVPMWDMAGLVG